VTLDAAGRLELIQSIQAGKYSGTLDAVKKIYAEEGALAFFKGLESCIWRHGVWSGGYFGVIHGVRAALPEAHTKEGVLFRNFVAGTIGGTIGTILNTPFDVVKTRVQGQLPGQPAKYGWAVPAIRIIAKEEGFGALYKGFTPKVLRLGPGGGILLVVFDQVTNFIRKHFM
jgi:solute carrier family 25 2-oxodicarboxylate transporter 21